MYMSMMNLMSSVLLNICNNKQNITDACELLKGTEMSSLKCTEVSKPKGSQLHVIINCEVDCTGGKYVADEQVPYIEECLYLSDTLVIMKYKIYYKEFCKRTYIPL